MKTKVGLSHEPKRKKPWLVYWWGDPDPDTGKQRKYSQAFKYNREAREFQASKQTELDQGGPRDTPVDATLGRLLDEFFESRAANLSHSSQECYRNTMTQLREHFGANRPIRLIARRQAETFMATRKRRDGRSGGLSTWTKRQILTYSKAVFRAAVDWGYIERNPFQPPGTGGSSPLTVKAKSKPWHHLIPKEFDEFLAVVTNVKRRAAYWFMYGCGLRPGEMYNITLDRIDLAVCRVHIVSRPATQEIPPFVVKCDEGTSSSKDRSVPIPDPAVPDITAACQEAFKSGGLVALTPERFSKVQEDWRLCRDGKPWGGRSKHRPWQNRDMLNNLLRDTKAYIRKAGVSLTAPFTLTTLRKSFAQNHADAGTPPRTLAKLLGHADVSTTMEFYNQVTDANERAASDTMSRLLGGKKKTAVNL